MRFASTPRMKTTFQCETSTGRCGGIHTITVKLLKQDRTLFSGTRVENSLTRRQVIRIAFLQEAWVLVLQVIKFFRGKTPRFIVEM